MNYPSRIPGQIPANVIHYYTEPNDLVVDLMAGGGSTLDAAKYLDRRCLAYDLVSIRCDIIENDALLGIPTEAKGAKLIFLDPPYGIIAKGFYDEHPHCLSRMNQVEFLEALATIGNHCREVLLNDGYLAVLVQNVYGWEGDTVFQIMERFIRQNWRLIRRIQVPISNQQIPPNVMKWARENRQMVNTDRDLLIFQMN
jgi:DNA modification methylase